MRVDTIVLIILVVVVVKVIGLVVWRFFVRRRVLPCPPWLSFILDNPRMKAVAGPKVIFGRIGLARGMKVPSMQQTDVAPTLAPLIGIALDRTDGRVLLGVLRLPNVSAVPLGAPPRGGGR